MAIILRLNVNDFRDEFEAYGRDNFSYEALEVLFNYYDNLSEDIGEDWELDVVSICCEWQEMDKEEILRQYSHYIDDEEAGEDEQLEQILDYLRGDTEVIDLEGGTWLVRGF